MTGGPIILVEDDLDDLELYKDVIRSIGIPNPVIHFGMSHKALAYLRTTSDQPFIIISDINLPGHNGLEFKQQIQQDDYLRNKGIPFVFVSTNATKWSIRQAHALSVQGYFRKPDHYRDIVVMFQTIFSYWEMCRHVNNT